MRCRWLLITILVALLCCAADLTSAQQPIKGWGKMIDPDGDCPFDVEKDRLTLTVLGRHDLSDDVPGNMNAPRIMQEIEGDFIALVKVGGAFRPVGPSTLGIRRPYNGGGLLIWQDDKNYVRLERAAVEVNGETPEYLNFQQWQDGSIVAGHSELGLKAEAVLIRLERRKGRLYAAASYDNRVWHGYPALEAKLPRKLQLGVIAVSTSATPFIPEFEEIEIYRGATPGAGAE